MTDLGLEVDTERGGVEFFAQFRSWAPRVNAYAESMKSEVTLGHDNGTRTGTCTRAWRVPATPGTLGRV